MTYAQKVVIETIDKHTGETISRTELSEEVYGRVRELTSMESSLADDPLARQTPDEWIEQKVKIRVGMTNLPDWGSADECPECKREAGNAPDPGTIEDLLSGAGSTCRRHHCAQLADKIAHLTEALARLTGTVPVEPHEYREARYEWEVIARDLNRLAVHNPYASSQW